MHFCRSVSVCLGGDGRSIRAAAWNTHYRLGAETVWDQPVGKASICDLARNCNRCVGMFKSEIALTLWLLVLLFVTNALSTGTIR